MISQDVLPWLSHLMGVDIPRFYGRELMQIADKGGRNEINRLDTPASVKEIECQLGLVSLPIRCSGLATILGGVL